MSHIFRIAALAGVAVAALGGCAASAPSTHAMGAGRACDVSVALGAERGCVVTHVSPAREEVLVTNGLRVQGSSPMTPPAAY